MKAYRHPHRYWKTSTSFTRKLLNAIGTASETIVFLAAASITLIFLTSLVYPPAGRAIDFIIANFTGWWPAQP